MDEPSAIAQQLAKGSQSTPGQAGSRSFPAIAAQTSTPWAIWLSQSQSRNSPGSGHLAASAVTRPAAPRPPATRASIAAQVMLREAGGTQASSVSGPGYENTSRSTQSPSASSGSPRSTSGMQARGSRR